MKKNYLIPANPVTQHLKQVKGPVANILNSRFLLVFSKLRTKRTACRRSGISSALQDSKWCLFLRFVLLPLPRITSISLESLFLMTQSENLWFNRKPELSASQNRREMVWRWKSCLHWTFTRIMIITHSKSQGTVRKLKKMWRLET